MNVTFEKRKTRSQHNNDHSHSELGGLTPDYVFHYPDAIWDIVHDKVEHNQKVRALRLRHANGNPISDQEIANIVKKKREYRRSVAGALKVGDKVLVLAPAEMKGPRKNLNELATVSMADVAHDLYKLQEFPNNTYRRAELFKVHEGMQDLDTSLYEAAREALRVTRRPAPAPAPAPAPPPPPASPEPSEETQTQEGGHEEEQGDEVEGPAGIQDGYPALDGDTHLVYHEITTEIDVEVPVDAVNLQQGSAKLNWGGPGNTDEKWMHTTWFTSEALGRSLSNDNALKATVMAIVKIGESFQVEFQPADGTAYPGMKNRIRIGAQCPWEAFRGWVVDYTTFLKESPVESCVYSVVQMRNVSLKVLYDENDRAEGRSLTELGNGEVRVPVSSYVMEKGV